MSWLPDTLPGQVRVNGLVFVPLTTDLLEQDYAAVMRDRALLQAWSGQSWPQADFTLDDNRVDLERHDREQQAGEALTYSVLLDGTVQGCVYVWPIAEAFRGRGVTLPSDTALPVGDVVVRGWLHDRTAGQLIAATMAWLNAPPFAFGRVWWQTNSMCADQVVACDALGYTESMAFAAADRTWVLRALPR